MITFKEQLERLTSAQHRLAVWEAVYSYLDDNFVSKDGRPCKILKAPGAQVDRVPETTIEDVLRTIGEGPIAELRADIVTIENQPIIVTSVPKEEAKS